MKKILAVVATGILITSCATMPKNAVEPLNQHQRVVEIPNTSKNQIFDGSKQWFAKNFKDSNSVIKYENAETGSIIGKGNMNFECIMSPLACAMFETGTPKDRLEFTVKVDAKDNKARVTFDGLNRHSPAKYVSGARFAETNTPLTLESEINQAKAMLDKTVDSLAKEVRETNTSSAW